MRILIVEDDHLVTLALKMFLAELGHTVVGTAADTIGAVRVIEEGVKADLAIVDLHLARGSSGIATAIQIRRLSGIASVFLTGDPKEPMPAGMRHSGVWRNRSAADVLRPL